MAVTIPEPEMENRFISSFTQTRGKKGKQQSHSLEKYTVGADRKALVSSEKLHIVQVRSDIGRTGTELERLATICGIPQTPSSTHGPRLVVVLDIEGHRNIQEKIVDKKNKNTACDV